MAIVDLLQFGPIFGFVLITALSFGVLQKVKFFGSDMVAVDMVVAAMLGMFAVSSDIFRSILSELVPYFLVFVVFLFFTILFFLMLGIKDDEIAGAFKDESEATVIIGVAVAIAILVLVNHFYTKVTEIAWLKNSYILGLIVFFVIAGFTVRQIAYEIPYAPISKK